MELLSLNRGLLQMIELQLALPNGGLTASVDAVVEIAEAAEDCGFRTLWVYDHLLPPRYLKNTYGEVLEPLVLLAHLAGKVPRLRLGTSVLVVPIRDPVLVAKQAATLDILSGGRLILGVGAGYVLQEFVNLHQDYHTRGARLDEAIRLFRHLFSGSAEPFDGLYYGYTDGLFGPLPIQRANLPIMIGGHSHAAVRRAAQLGDMWQASGITPGRFADSVLELRNLAGNRKISVGARIGAHFNRSYGDFDEESPEYLLTSIGGWAAAGADHVNINFGAQKGFLRRMRRFADAFAGGRGLEPFLGESRVVAASSKHWIVSSSSERIGPESNASQPMSSHLTGNIAPGGALWRSRHDATRWQRAPAKVFELETAAVKAIEIGQIHSGTIIVIRNQLTSPNGPIPELSGVMQALAKQGLTQSVTVITDGRISPSAVGSVIEDVTPSAAIRGPLAAIVDGDIICIDVVAGRVDVEYVDLSRRLAELAPGMSVDD
jgi:probable F420-dependent oxidoreductase